MSIAIEIARKLELLKARYDNARNAQEAQYYMQEINKLNSQLKIAQDVEKQSKAAGRASLNNIREVLKGNNAIYATPAASIAPNKAQANDEGWLDVVDNYLATSPYWKRDAYPEDMSFAERATYPGQVLLNEFRAVPGMLLGAVEGTGHLVEGGIEGLGKWMDDPNTNTDKLNKLMGYQEDIPTYTPEDRLVRDLWPF